MLAHTTRTAECRPYKNGGNTMGQENEFLKAALERLKQETKGVTGSKEKAMAAAVGAALADFF